MPVLVNIENRMWFNPSLESKNYILPGSIAIIITMIGTLLTAMVVAREWERGTMEAMMATPVRIQEIILGKLLPYYGLGLGSMFFCAVVSVFAFRTPFRGSFLSLFLFTSLYLFTCLGIGLLVSTLAKSQFVARPVCARARVFAGCSAIRIHFRNFKYAAHCPRPDLSVPGKVFRTGPAIDLSGR